MVEQQVVGLEVEGSSPSIYPLFSAGLQPNLANNKFIRNKVLLYLIITLRSQWANFFNMILAKNFSIDEMSYHTLFNKLRAHNTDTKFFNLTPQVFTDNFRTLKRMDPIIRPVRQNFFNKMLTDFDKSVDKIDQLMLFNVFLRANLTLGFTNFVPHASQRSLFVKYYKKGVAFSSVPRFYASWSNAYNLMFNVIFYKIDILTFGNAFFKNEILALN